MRVANRAAEDDEEDAGWRGRADELTVGDICDLYLAEGMETGTRSWRRQAAMSFRNHVKPRLGERLARDLTPRDVDRLFASVAKGEGAGGRSPRAPGGRYAANAVHSALGAALAHAVRRGLLPENPARGMRRFPDRHVARFLSKAEYARVGQVLAAAEALYAVSPVALDCIRFIILTGLRPSEARSLTWSQVRLGGAALFLPTGSNGSRTLWLGEPARRFLAELRRIRGKEHLFPGRRAGAPLSDLGYAWKRIRGAAELDGVRLLDLRHSFLAMAAGSGVEARVAGQLLGVRSAVTLERYPRVSDAVLRGAADRVSSEIASLLGAPAAAQGPVASSDDSSGAVLSAAAATRWLKTAEVAAISGYAVATLSFFRSCGIGPPYRRVGPRVLYPEEPFLLWLLEAPGRGRQGRSVVSRRARRRLKRAPLFAPAAAPQQDGAP